MTLLFIFLWCIILQAGILLIFLNTPWGDQAFKKSLVGFFSAGAGLPRGPENQYAKSDTSFSSRFRFNEGRAFKNKRVAYFSEGASLPRWQWYEEPTLGSSRAPLKEEWGEQTGNFYYGARYYDPKISVWLSVDPLAHEFPYISPYNFVENNPLMLIDPTGMGPEGAEGGPKTHTIVPDDTYYGLAKRTYKDDPTVTVENLRLWNPGVDENDLKLDQVINLSDPNQGPDRNQGANSDQQTNSSQAQDNSKSSNQKSKSGDSNPVKNLSRSICNSFIITSTGLAMPIFAAIGNANWDGSDAYLDANPFFFDENFNFRQINGSTQEIGVEAMKGTIGVIFTFLPTTLPFWQEQAVTTAASEGANIVIDKATKK